MSYQLARANLLQSVKKITEAMRRRDPREPGRREKEDIEKQMARILRRVLKKQADLAQARLELFYPERKATTTPPINLTAWAWDEEDFNDLVALLRKAVTGGISIFGIGHPIIDYSLTNIEAAKWARNYAFDLVKNIGETTKQILQEAIDLFVQTPGMTIRDIMDTLPFGESRAMTVAITETTRAYAQGNQMAGEALKKEFPDVRVIKIWFTNNDDRVCDLCGPLEGKEVDIDDTFYDPDEYNDGNPPRHVNCRCWTNTTTALANLED